MRKTTTLHVHYAFLYISQPSLRECDMKFPNLMRPLYEVREHKTTIKFCFPFSKLRYSPFGLNSRKFRHHLTN